MEQTGGVEWVVGGIGADRRSRADKRRAGRHAEGIWGMGGGIGAGQLGFASLVLVVVVLGLFSLPGARPALADSACSGRGPGWQGPPLVARACVVMCSMCMCSMCVCVCMCAAVMCSMCVCVCVLCPSDVVWTLCPSDVVHVTVLSRPSHLKRCPSLRPRTLRSGWRSTRPWVPALRRLTMPSSTSAASSASTRRSRTAYA